MDISQSNGCVVNRSNIDKRSEPSSCDDVNQDRSNDCRFTQPADLPNSLHWGEKVLHAVCCQWKGCVALLHANISIHREITEGSSALPVWAHVAFFVSTEITYRWKLLGIKSHQLKESRVFQLSSVLSFEAEESQREAGRFKGPSSVVFNSRKFAWVESEGRICHMDEILVVFPSPYRSGHNETSSNHWGAFFTLHCLNCC